MGGVAWAHEYPRPDPATPAGDLSSRSSSDSLRAQLIRQHIDNAERELDSIMELLARTGGSPAATQLPREPGITAACWPKPWPVQDDSASL
jgi:hypothetical protein